MAMFMGKKNDFHFIHFLRSKQPLLLIND